MCRFAVGISELILKHFDIVLVCWNILMCEAVNKRMVAIHAKCGKIITKDRQKGEIALVVAIVGSRGAKGFDREKIRQYLPENCTAIISGGAAGVDAQAELFARENAIPFRKILPDYGEFGKNAPLLRDTAIVRQADSVLAFWDFKSRGTSFTIAECIRLGVPVRIIGLDD